MTAVLAAYCWPQSLLPGQTVEVFVTSSAAQVSIEILRDGPMVEIKQVHEHIDAGEQPVPPNASAVGCAWTPNFECKVDESWRSGLYLVRVRADEQVCDAFFVVRQAAQNSDAVDGIWVLSSSTWHAYNDWGGTSFYTGGHSVARRRPLPPGFLSKADPATHRIARYQDWTKDEARAFGRAGYSEWSMAAGWANWERLFACWAEMNGYRLAYALSEDLHADPGLLAPYRLYVSVGHDEYWSCAMRDHVENYVGDGGHAAFFSGNTSFWQVRFSAGTEVLTSYKMALHDDPYYDEVSAPNLSTMWCDPLVGRTEAQMTGVSFSRGGYAHMPNSPRGSGGYEVHRPDHWALAGTGLGQGDQLGAAQIVVGYECDGCAIDDGGSHPMASGEDGAPPHLEIIGTAPARLWETEQLPETLRDDYVGELNWVAQRLGGEDSAPQRARFSDGHAVLASFARGAGEVFTTGCTDWAYGLSQNAEKDNDIDRVTRNVLQRFRVEST